MSLKQQGRQVLARVTPRTKLISSDEPGFRRITVKQLALLIYHFYVTVDNPAIGFEDADQTAAAFQAELNQTVEISDEILEKLLWHLTLAFEENMYWNPAEETIDTFIKGLLEKDESFDKLFCLILNKKGTNYYGD